MTRIGNIDEIVAALKSYDPERVILFGSQARGEADEESDIDLVVIKETEEPFLDRLERLYELDFPPGARDIFVYTPGEFQDMWEKGNPFVESVVAEGVIVYQRPGTEGKDLVKGRAGMRRDPRERPSAGWSKPRAT